MSRSYPQGVAGAGEKVHQGQVYAGHASFDSVQAAIDLAGTEGHQAVVVPPGNYGAITVDVENLRLMCLSGSGRGVTFDGGTTDHAITVDTRHAAVIGARAITTAGQGNALDAFHVPSTGRGIHTFRDCQAIESDRHGFFVDNTEVSVESCDADDNALDGDGVRLGGNSDACLVVHNTITSITDNGGADNVVANNT